MTEEPKGMTKAFHYEIGSSFNDLVCLEHTVLNKLVVSDFMDSCNSLFHGAIVSARTVHEAFDHYEMIWVSQYGYPKSLIADQAFITEEFQMYAESVGIKLPPESSPQYTRSVLELKHQVL